METGMDVRGTTGIDTLFGTASADTYEGLQGSDTIVASGGSDVITGGFFRPAQAPPAPLFDSTYDQINYPGRASEYTFSFRNGKIIVTKPNGGSDTIDSIEGIWFQDEQAWYPIGDLVDGVTITRTFSETEILMGTRGNDTLTGADVLFDAFIGSAGSDSLDGRGAEYDQIDYAGSSSQYTFNQGADGVIVNKPDGGTDTLKNIDGLWFSGEGAWYALADLLDAGTGSGTDGNDLISGTRGDDVLSGLGGADVFDGSGGSDVIYGSGEGLADTDYDQVDYSGARADYRFERAGEAVHVFKPDGSRDTLVGIDGFWFGGEAQWYSTASLLGPDVAA